MARHFPSWLHGYLEYTQQIEAPTTFHMWVGISTLASALQRKVWLDFRSKHIRVFPSLFIVLTAPPGICRKGSIINLGLDLLRKLKGPHILANDITREKLLKEMSTSGKFEHTIETEAGLTNYTHCSVTCVAEEFSTLIGFSNMELLATLTALWNCDPEYKYSTKTSGEHIVTNVFCNILAGTTPQWLTSSLPSEAIGGGFTSRILFVHESRTEKVVALTDDDLPQLDPQLERKLLEDLSDIFKMKGQMLWTKEAGEFYKDWYTKFRTTPQKALDDRFQYYLARKPIMVWKVALCLSAGVGTDMVITKGILKTALNLIEQIEPEMPKAFGGIGMSDLGTLMSKIRSYLQSYPEGLEIRTLMQVLWQDVTSAQALSEAMENWITAGAVVRVETNTGRRYKWNPNYDKEGPSA